MVQKCIQIVFGLMDIVFMEGYVCINVAFHLISAMQIADYRPFIAGTY